MATGRTLRRRKRVSYAGADQPGDHSDDDFGGERASDAEDPDEMLSAQEEPKTPTTRKRLRKATSLPKKTRRPKELSAPDPGTSDLSTLSQNIAQSASIFGPLRLTPSPATANLTRWLAVREQLQVKTHTQPTKIEVQHLSHLGDLPDMPGRDFKFDNIECVDLEVTWDPVEGDDLNVTKLGAQAQRDAIEKYAKIIKT